MPASDKQPGANQTQAKTRVLLAMWDIGGTEKEVKKSELNNRVIRTHEKAGDYQGIFEQLEQAGAIAFSNKKITLCETGVQMLRETLNSPEFEFDGHIIGTKTANALLKWMRQMGTLSNGVVALATASGTQIKSYEAFKPEALALFEKLDKGYNYSGLVPIWHLRREMGERVSREEFTDWMMEMQGEQLFYLQSGEARGATEDQKRDSISSDIRGLLFYASQLS